ncbi:M15 family metallopeptidase [Mycobacterium sp. CnD-18-1]|uniref:M15 family metallopeptidase n=1 Tax=Mycobacterium sp. CnD-18-1 TaxID=2917744 RepID=UPI001EF38D0D|nr:M15 family metallopeptidase [Mycobacterium sp. CnD-18-1]MCG7607068.1 M15 family metallopeptidase [Mycobacterium sp. CnD-18-1]
MANRVVYGNSFSSNQWPMVDQGSCTWVKIPGTNCTLQIQNGWPLAILRAFAADLNAYVEPMRDPDSACWTATNSVSTSNHLSGTAFDYNWNSHPFQVPDAGWSQAQLATIRELQAFYEGTVFFGNDWGSPKDAMHFQLASLANGGDINTYGNPAVGNFIARKIRADGFSTFRRGNAPSVDAAQILSDAMGGRLSLDRYRQLLPAVRESLLACDCTNVNRIAMWCAQIGHESAGLYYTEEIASGAAYEGRADLGNTQPGDGVRFKGRSWIQITGRSNYTRLSQWAFNKGLVPTRTFFVDNPARLSDDQYAGLGAAWYWVVARPDINALSDARDLVTVTRRINGGTNGLADRQSRYNHALALGDQLLTLINSGDDDEMAGWDQAKVERAMVLLENIAGVRRPSLSPLRHVGEGDVNTCAGFAWSADGLTHAQFVFMAAKQGHADSLELLAEIAGADVSRYPERADDKKLAQGMLAEIEATNPAVLQNYLAQKGVA